MRNYAETSKSYDSYSVWHVKFLSRCHIVENRFLWCHFLTSQFFKKALWFPLYSLYSLHLIRSCLQLRFFLKGPFFLKKVTSVLAIHRHIQSPVKHPKGVFCSYSWKSLHLRCLTEFLLKRSTMFSFFLPDSHWCPRNSPSSNKLPHRQTHQKGLTKQKKLGLAYGVLSWLM